MDYYFVAKSTEGGYIGQLTFDEIVRRLRTGELSGNYVAAKSSGGSYSDVMKSGLAAWVTVDELVANPPVSGTSQAQAGTAPLLTRQGIALMRRYNDAYLVARAVDGVGGLSKGIGVAIAALLVLVGLMIVSNGRAGDATFAMGIVVIASGVATGAWFYVLGILVSAQGQILKASLDSAVNGSPFLANEHRARIMSLPEA